MRIVLVLNSQWGISVCLLPALGNIRMSCRSNRGLNEDTTAQPDVTTHIESTTDPYTTGSDVNTTRRFSASILQFLRRNRIGRFNNTEFYSTPQGFDLDTDYNDFLQRDSTRGRDEDSELLRDYMSRFTQSDVSSFLEYQDQQDYTADFNSPTIGNND